MEKEFIRYLSILYNYEEDRQKTIENKLSQLLGQSGLVFTLSSLFIPLFYSHLINASVCFIIFCIALFMFAQFLLSWCFFIVSKTLDVRQYRYMVGSILSLNRSFKSVQDFNKMEIEDMKKSIETNQETNNLKATHLILASRKFAFGIIVIGILSLVILSGLLINKNSPSKIEISNQINLDNLEKNIYDINKNLNDVKDSIDSLKLKNEN